MGRRRMKNYNPMAIAESPMTAPDSRVTVGHNDDGTLDEVVGTGDFHLEQMDTNAWWMQLGPHMVWLRARGKITAHFGENEALARGPQQAGGEDWPKVMGEYLAIMTRCDDAIRESGKATLSRADMEAIERYNLADEHLSMMQADRVANAEAEVARLRERTLEMERQRDDYLNREWVATKAKQAAEAKMAEVWADARTLAASVHGAFGALGSDPPEPILKLANRYFLMKRRGRRSAALNGGQDDNA